MGTPTTNKGLILPTVGGESATWGNDLNNNTITPIDLMLGGVDSISLSSANYTLSSTEIQNLVVKLSGALLENVTVFSACIGFFIVENNTSGAFSVTIQAVTSTSFPSSGSTVGSGIVIGQGSRNFFVSDQAVGIRRADTSLLPSGTVTDFFQASAPTGWTQVVTLNDFAMRIVSGTGGGSHAGSGFLGGSTDGHALVIGEMPSHGHTYTDPGHTHTYQNPAFFNSNVASGGANLPLNTPQNTLNTGNSTIGITINNTGGGGSHSHNLSGLSMIDLILCTKN
jgi:hypothetical protein